MKNSKEVDWDVAPESATHYNGALSYPWLRGVPVSFYNGNDWIEYKSDDSLWEDHFFNAVKRPQGRVKWWPKAVHLNALLYNQEES